MTLHRLLTQACVTFVLLTLVSLVYAEPRMLRITTSPGGAQMLINGQRNVNRPGSEGQTIALKLPQGDYTVEARKSDGEDYYGKKSVYGANDSLRAVTISLAEVKQPAKPHGQAPNGSAKLGGLEWLRCSLGQSWSGSSCTGVARKYTFEEAKTAAVAFNATGYDGKSDWRVPTVRELQSLRVCSTGFVSDAWDIQDSGKPVSKICNDNARSPTIDTAQFPQMPDGWFWTSSPNLDSVLAAWTVDFYNGFVLGYGIRFSAAYVRLVRTTQ